MSGPRDPDVPPELDDVARLLDEVAALEDREAKEADALERAPGLEKVGPMLEAAWSGKLLDEVANVEKTEAKEADALRHAPGLDKVGPTLEKAWAGAGSARADRGDADGAARRPVSAGRWIRRAILFAAAAGILLYVGIRVGRDSNPSGPSGTYLSDGEFRVVHPPERATSWDRIEWSGPAQGTYRVRVRDASDGRVLLGPTDVNGNTSLPLRSEDTARWSKRIRIEVEIRRADGSWVSAPPRISELQS